MIKGKRVLAVVPARGGSKGIPLKNIKKVNGVPLVGIVADIINNIDLIDRAVVSTDHPEIVKVSKEYGLDAPFMRPDKLSGDTVGDIPVLQHALEEAERIDDTQYDIIVMLQPTSPLRTTKEVVDTISKLIDDELDAVWTVSVTDSKNHPLKQLVLNENKLGYYDDKGRKIIARQQLKTVFHRNGVAYALTRECVMQQKSLKGLNTYGLILNANHISIDTEWDLELVEYIMNKRGNGDNIQ
jgi:CMP-N-acetylneuraminic acid synthetase